MPTTTLPLYLRKQCRPSRCLTTPINLSPVADSGKRVFLRARKDQQPNQQLFFFRWPPTKCTFRLAPRKECVFGSSALQPAMSGMGGGDKMSGCRKKNTKFFPDRTTKKCIVISVLLAYFLFPSFSRFFPPHIHPSLGTRYTSPGLPLPKRRRFRRLPFPLFSCPLVGHTCRSPYTISLPYSSSWPAHAGRGVCSDISPKFCLALLPPATYTVHESAVGGAQLFWTIESEPIGSTFP